jgi:uncharacterized membrane protein YeaQ/YmgE (transglycosylase-associated protein family)
MKSLMNSLLQKKWLVTTLVIIEILALFAIINWHQLYVYFTSPYLLGWDSSSHFGIAKYYSDNIFPSFFGWAHSWFLGMAFPQFYPPVFYYLFSVLERISIFDTLLTFKIMVFGSFFVTPLLLGLLYYKKINKENNDWLVVILFGYLLGGLSIYMTNLGFGFLSITESGLLPHGMAIMLFVVWFYFMCSFLERPINRFMASVMGAIVLLTNAHMNYVCLLFYALFFIKDSLLNYQLHKDYKIILKNVFLPYFVYGLGMAMVISFWYFPMISLYEFSIARSLDFNFWNKPDFFLTYSYIFFIALINFSVLVHKRKFGVLFVINTAALLAFALLLINFREFDYLPFHTDRIFAIIYLFTPIIILTFLNSLRENHKFIYHLSIICTIIFILFINFTSPRRAHFLEYASNADRFSEVISALKKYNNSTILTEIIGDQNASSLTLSNFNGVNGNSELYTVFREASVSSIFITPIRNLFSKFPEHWSIRSRLAVDHGYLTKAVDNKVEDLRLFGVTDVLVTSKEVKDEIASSTEMQLKERAENWNVYEVKYDPAEDNRYFKILEYKPIVVFSDFETKKYLNKKSDYLYIAEELLRYSSEDIHIINASLDDIDSLDLDNVSSVFIEENFMNNNPELIQRLRDKDKDITILLPNELSVKYRGLKDPNIKFYRSLSQIKNIDAGYQFIKGLDDYVTPYEGLRLSHENVEFNDRKTSYEITNNSSSTISVIIKRSFFPTWRTSSGQKIYQVNPNFMLITLQPKQTETLYFYYPKAFFAGHYTSLAGLIILLVLFLIERLRLRGK